VAGSAKLWSSSGDRNLSTSAVCSTRRRPAPTLYHYFGSKQGLIDAVINYGSDSTVEAADDRSSNVPLDEASPGMGTTL